VIDRDLIFDENEVEKILTHLTEKFKNSDQLKPEEPWDYDMPKNFGYIISQIVKQIYGAFYIPVLLGWINFNIGKLVKLEKEDYVHDCITNDLLADRVLGDCPHYANLKKIENILKDRWDIFSGLHICGMNFISKIPKNIYKVTIYKLIEQDKGDINKKTLLNKIKNILINDDMAVKTLSDSFGYQENANNILKIINRKFSESSDIHSLYPVISGIVAFLIMNALISDFTAFIKGDGLLKNINLFTSKAINNFEEHPSYKLKYETFGTKESNRTLSIDIYKKFKKYFNIDEYLKDSLVEYSDEELSGLWDHFKRVFFLEMGMLEDAGIYNRLMSNSDLGLRDGVNGLIWNYVLDKIKDDKELKDGYQRLINRIQLDKESNFDLLSKFYSDRSDELSGYVEKLKNIILNFDKGFSINAIEDEIRDIYEYVDWGIK